MKRLDNRTIEVFTNQRIGYVANGFRKKGFTHIENETENMFVKDGYATYHIYIYDKE